MKAAKGLNEEKGLDATGHNKWAREVPPVRSWDGFGLGGQMQGYRSAD